MGLARARYKDLCTVCSTPDLAQYIRLIQQIDQSMNT